MSKDIKPKHNNNDKNVQTKIIKNVIKDFMEKSLLEKKIIENTINEYLKKEKSIIIQIGYFYMYKWINLL